MKEKKYICECSGKTEAGQATVELVALLVGFVSIFLGMVFICSLADSDIAVFLAARHSAEQRAANQNAVTGTGAEFSHAINSNHEIYEDRPVLVFAPGDQPNYSAHNTIGSFPAAFSGNNSMPSGGDDYALQARLDKWKNLRNADSYVFRSDFVGDLYTKNAFEAARMVSGSSSSENQFYLIDSRHHKPGNSSVLRKGLRSWFGISISDNALENAPGNRVYMPVTR